MVRVLIRGAMDIEGALCEASDAGEDLVRGLGPNERLGLRVVDVDELADGLLEFGDATVTAASDLLLRQLREPALNEIEPGAVGRSEVDVEARPLGEPVTDDRGLVGAVVVHDHVDVQVRGDVVLDGVQEAAELDRTVTAVDLAENLSGLDVEGSEERRGAVALVVVGAAFNLSGPHRQEGLGPVESLDLGLLVYTQHQRVVRRVHIETDHVTDL